MELRPLDVYNYIERVYPDETGRYEVDPQVGTHEAKKLKGGHDPSEMGAKGAAQREANWAERIGKHREELDKLTPDALRVLGKVLKDERDPRVSPTAFGILDRIGLGPSSKQEVSVQGSERLAAIIAELDAEPSE